MDWLTFIAQIAGTLAWPAVIVVLLILLRRELAGLAARLQSLKLPGGTEAQFFREVLEEAKADVERLSQRPTRVITHDAAPDFEKLERENDAFEELSKNFPEASVMYSFQKVESVLDEISQKLGLRRGAPRAAIAALRNQNLLDKQLVDLYIKLSTLRNMAVHRETVNLTEDEALAYGRLATAAEFQLRQILARLDGRH
jgi:uncharacterized protein YutE (UPF0331/DUF86 family)